MSTTWAEISATVELSQRRKTGALVVRFRHPDEKPIRSVIVNGTEWTNFDTAKEQVVIPGPETNRYIISVKY